MNSKEDERSFFLLFKILLSFKISRKGLIVKKNLIQKLKKKKDERSLILLSFKISRKGLIVKKIILKNHSIQKLKKQDIAKV